MTKRPTYSHCPMCGLAFEQSESVCERGCPLSAGCGSRRCPGCGYEFPEEARSISWLGRLFRRRGPRRASPENGRTVSLAGLRTGERASLLDLDHVRPSRRNTLTVFGLTPGTEITLLQRHPSFVIRVGETELGLDREIAEGIYVRRD